MYKKADIKPSDKYVKFRFNTENSPECIMTLRPAGGMGRNSDNDCKNRKNILKELGINKYFRLNQIHSRIVHNADDLSEESIKDGDGLFSFRKENILAVTVADCMPVFFFNRKSGVFGVLHSGWKGTGISAEALNCIEKYSSGSPDDFEFILGPSIGPCCYEVDRERASVFKNLYGSDTVICRGKENCKQHEEDKRMSENYVPEKTDKPNNTDSISYRETIKRKIKSKNDRISGKPENTGYYLDLRKANINILEKEGIKNITVMENCTCCSNNFHSFRRDGAEQFQLMLALIGYFI